MFAWRKLYGREAELPPAPRLVSVTVTPDRPAAPPSSGGMIEIELPRGYQVRVAAA